MCSAPMTMPLRSQNVSSDALSTTDVQRGLGGGRGEGAKGGAGVS